MPARDLINPWELLICYKIYEMMENDQFSTK